MRTEIVFSIFFHFFLAHFQSGTLVPFTLVNEKSIFLMLFHLLMPFSIHPVIMAGFELVYHDLGNTIHFSFFTMQIFRSSLKIMILKRNRKKEMEFFP